jgi:hypothetical protein
MILVFAGNYEEAATWAHERHLPTNMWRFVDSFRDVCGYDSRTQFVQVGTWTTRRDLDDALAVARERLAGYREGKG